MQFPRRTFLHLLAGAAALPAAPRIAAALDYPTRPVRLVVGFPPVWVWLIAPALPTVAVMAAAVLPAFRASTTVPLMIMRDDR